MENKVKFDPRDWIMNEMATEQVPEMWLQQLVTRAYAAGLSASGRQPNGDSNPCTGDQDCKHVCPAPASGAQPPADDVIIHAYRKEEHWFADVDKRLDHSGFANGDTLAECLQVAIVMALRQREFRFKNVLEVMDISKDGAAPAGHALSEALEQCIPLLKRWTQTAMEDNLPQIRATIKYAEAALLRASQAGSQ